MELIKVKTTKKGTKIVSARDLYIGLGLRKSEWSRWAKRNIIENEFFIENTHWVGFVVMTNGNETRDYAISLEFAKHLAMMARTEKSHEYRNYFIKMEKIATEVITDKDRLYMKIGRGGVDAVLASKELLEIETAELKVGEDKRLTTGMVVEELKERNDVLAYHKMTTTDFNKWLVATGLGSWEQSSPKDRWSRGRSYFEPNSLFINNIANKGFAITGKTASNNRINRIIYLPGFIDKIEEEYMDSLVSYMESIK